MCKLLEARTARVMPIYIPQLIPVQLIWIETHYPIVYYFTEVSGGGPVGTSVGQEESNEFVPRYLQNTERHR